MRRRSFGEVYEKPGRPGFYVRVRWRGLKLKRHAGPTRDVAKSNLSKLEVRLKAGTPLEKAAAEVFGDRAEKRTTFEEATKQFLEHRQGRVKTSTYSGDVRRLRVLCGAGFAKKALVEISPADFIRWSEERRRTASGATINRDLTLASALFKWAERMGLVKENPLRKVPKFSEKGRAREVYLTAPESRALIDAADDVMRPFLHAALATGARRGELMRLRWRDVDFDRREIIIHPENEKAGRGRVIPMTADFQAELVALRKARQVTAFDGSDNVFLQANGHPITEEVIKKGFARALRNCACIGNEKREQMVLHSLRHSCASLMVAAGVQLLDVARILGHSTLSVTMRYAHFSPESGRAAIEKLGKALAPPKALSEAAAQ